MMPDLTKLLKKISQGDYEVVEDYIRECAGDSTEEYTRLLWSMGIPVNSKILIDVLIDNGANVNSTNNKGESLLHMVGTDGYNVAEHLIRRGCKINARDLSGMTPLHVACEKGYVDIARLLIEKGAALNARDLRGRTPLYVACECDHMDVAMLLANRDDVDVSIPDRKGISVLHWACVRGEEWLYRILFERSSPEIKHDNSLMHWACLGDSVEVIKFLVSRGILVNEKDSTGKTPLIKLCTGNNVDMVRYLVKEGDVDLNVQDDIGFTALHFACINGQYEMVKILLEQDIDMNIKNKTGLTALHIACLSENEDIALLLIEKGASLDSIELSGKLPIYYACKKDLVNVVISMIKKGSAIEFSNHNTVLHWASGRGYSLVVDALIERNVDVNLQDFLGKSALHFASCVGDVNMVRKLLSNGALVDIRDKGEGTPLHLACRYQFYDVAEELIRNGADVNAEDVVGQTALYLACKNGDQDMVSLLIRHQAKVDSLTLTGDSPLHAAYINNFPHILKFLVDKVGSIPNYIMDWIVDEQEFEVMETLILKRKEIDVLMRRLVVLNKKQALNRVSQILKGECINISSSQMVSYNSGVNSIPVPLLSIAILKNSLDVADILMRNNSCKVEDTIEKLSELLNDEMSDNFLKEIKNSTVNKIRHRKREIENMIICKLIHQGKNSKLVEEGRDRRRRMSIAKIGDRERKRICQSK